MNHQSGHNSLSPIAVDAVDMYERPHTHTHIALWLKVIGEGPGGHEKAFWDPVYTTSMPHLSVKKGTAPKEATVSTTRIQLYLWGGGGGGEMMWGQ